MGNILKDVTRPFKITRYIRKPKLVSTLVHGFLSKEKVSK